MPTVQRMSLSHVMFDFYDKINRRKKLDGDMLETPMKRCLSTFDLTMLGEYIFNSFTYNYNLKKKLKRKKILSSREKIL